MSTPAGKTICQAASGDQKDFSIDTFLGEVAEKVGTCVFTTRTSCRTFHRTELCVMQYENAQNKPAVAAWAGGAVFAIFFAEWLIHKPGLNIVSLAAPQADPCYEHE